MVWFAGVAGATLAAAALPAASRYTPDQTAPNRAVAAGLVLAATILATVTAITAPGGAVVSWAFVATAAIVPVLAWIDLTTRRLPFAFAGGIALAALTTMAIAALTGHGTWTDTTRAITCALLAAGFMLTIALIAPDGLGLGDVTLAGALTLTTGHLGWAPATTSLLTGLALGAIAGAITIARHGRGTTFPLGPYLLAGWWITTIVHTL